VTQIVEGSAEEVVTGLVGAGIGESLSPALHEREAGALGFDCTYRVFDLDELGRSPQEVGELVRETRREGLRGVNVTHPCKQLIAPELDRLSPEAAALGAVNTIVFAEEELVGHNTDSTGFREAFERRLPAARLGRVVLLGAGGAGSAVGYAILSLRARELVVVDADVDRADALAATLGPLFDSAAVRPADLSEIDACLADADGLIHATPTGMDSHPGTAVPAELLHEHLWVAELVYLPVETELLGAARARGCRTLDGAAMVALQAAGSLELFTGARPDRERMLRHVDALFAERRSAAA
jgi:shikimate dehydrogenase